MCGRYTLARGEKVLEVVQNITMKEDLREVPNLFDGRFNIAPTQDVLVIANRLDAGKFVVEGMRWGLVTFWAKDVSIGGKMINARAETLAEKRAFRQCLERRRCVIPADGFYEWRTNPGGGKTPMYIRMKDGRAFGFAGLWEVWRDESGEVLKTCIIITTTANAITEKFHERMPVILTPEGIRAWLNPDERPADEMTRLLKPYPAEEMEAYPVSRAVNNVRNQGDELIRPILESDLEPPPAPTTPPARRKKKSDENQGSLF